ncbi:metabotropic glutamate receptor 3-like [Montipora capricornis]|uniref:metabotropic glutamate receptor 3-like n=1 Tax=Montipora foliosa TaxID=591990 RepID=UPI0035F12E8F
MQAAGIALIVLVISAHSYGSASSVTENSRSYKPGNVTLGGLFLLHYITEGGQCGEFFPTGLGHVVAMISTIDEINSNSSILPNVTLGYDIRDYCHSPSKAMNHTYNFVRKNEIALSYTKRNCSSSSKYYQAENETRSPIAAVIGPTDSGASVLVGSLLEVAGIPVVSHSATSNELSSPQYRNFFRTAPPDSQQARAMADIIEHFNWSYVAAVAMDDSYGRNGVWTLETEAESRKKFCIAFAEFIPREEYIAMLTRSVTKIKRYSNIRVVLLWLFGSYAQRFLKEAVKQNLNDRTWILSDGLASQDDVFVGLNNNEPDILHGSLGIRPRFVEDLHLEKSVVKEVNSNKFPWLEKLGKQELNCSLSETRSNWSDCQEALHDLIHDSYFSYVVDAVFAVAWALHDMQNCVMPKRNTSDLTDECPDLRYSFDPKKLESYLRRVDFKGQTGRISFDKFGDPVSASYDIIHFKRSNTRPDHHHPEKLVIGSWERGRKPQLNLSTEDIFWNSKQSHAIPPSSFCQEDCPPGTFRSLTTPCCWECITCPAGTSSKKVNSLNCTECPLRQKPNKERSKCLDLPEDVLMWSSVTSVLVSLFAAIGIALVFVLGAIFYKNRNTPLVKAANRELSAILLVTICLSFTASILTLAKSTNFTCGLGICLRSTLLTTFISIMTLKTTRILSAFRINVIAERLKRITLAARSQSLLVLGLLSFHVILLSLWITLDPPRQERATHPVKGTILLRCTLHRSSIGFTFQIAVSVYTSFLAIICTFYAFKARALPENFNEARYIAFSMYVLVFSAVAYYPIDLGLTGSHATKLTCAGTLLSSYGLLLCMFGPKIYVILCQPEQNTREAVCSQVSEHCFSKSHTGRMRSELTQSMISIHVSPL